MSWREDSEELLALLDECSATFPVRLFSNSPEKDSTPVRRIAFALENMIDQLKKPLVPSTQALAQSLVYKFNGPHRRQGYWMNFKNLSRSLRKYNDNDLLRRIADVHKKAMASGVGFYMPSNDIIRYFGSSYLKRLFRLQQIRELCIRTAHVIMGQLELGHWEKFSLFIVALCADINHGISKQACGMKSAYDKISSLLTSLDNRFPTSLTDLSVFPDLCGKVNGQKTVDTTRVMRLLQMSDEQLEVARSRDQMAIFRDEVLSSIDTKTDSVDLGTTIDRAAIEDEESDVMPTAERRKPSTTDSGLEPDYASAAANIASDDTATKESLPTSGKKHKKKLRKRKKKEQHFSFECSSSSVLNNSGDDLSTSEANVTTLPFKNRKRKSSDQAVSDAHSQSFDSPSVFSSVASSTIIKKKKKKLKKSRTSEVTMSTNFDVPLETNNITNACTTEHRDTPRNKVLKRRKAKKSVEGGAVSRKRKSADFSDSFLEVMPSKKKNRLNGS